MPDAPSDTISDTSPIQYLFQTNLLHLLPLLYTTIVVPPAVVRELTDGRARGVPLPDLNTCDWIKVRRVRERRLLPLATHLGSGEREAIALALETPGSLVLLDDANARRHAKLLGIRVSGTLGVLLEAKANGHLRAVAPVLELLDALHFHLDAGTRAHALALAGE